MALIKCHECGNDVSTEASACPKCGAIPKVQKKKSNALSKGQVLFTLIVLVPGMIWIAASTDTSGNQQQKKVDPDQLDPDACKKDLQCWGDKFMSAANVYCKDSIERQASFSVKWTDEGMFDSKFSRFGWLDQKAATLRYLGDKAQFQNGFGAYQNVIYECDIDPETNKILGVNVDPGHL